MSPNWIQRPYCRKEFDSFLALRKAAGVANPAARAASGRQGLRGVERAPGGIAGAGRIPVLCARRPGRRQRREPLLQPRQVRRPVLQGGRRARRGPAAAGLPHRGRRGRRPSSDERGPDRRAERAHRFSVQARKRHEGRLWAPGQRASRQGLHHRAGPGCGPSGRRGRRGFLRRRARQVRGLRPSRRRQAGLCARRSRSAGETAARAGARARGARRKDERPIG